MLAAINSPEQEATMPHVYICPGCTEKVTEQ